MTRLRTAQWHAQQKQGRFAVESRQALDLRTATPEMVRSLTRQAAITSLPFVDGPTLRSTWTSVPQPPDPLFVLDVTADGAIWLAGITGLYFLDEKTRKWQCVWKGSTGHSVTAISNTDAWAIVKTDDKYRLRHFNVAGQMQEIAKLPEGAEPKTVSGAFDGTLWVRPISDDRSYAYQIDQDAWTLIPDNGLQITELFIGSKDNIWGLAVNPDQEKMAVRYSSETGWQEEPVVTRLKPESIQPCLDGGVWIQTEEAFILNPAEGDWDDALVFAAHEGALPDIFFSFAASPHRLYQYFVPTNSVRCLAVGITDYPDTTWPNQSPGEREAYSYISSELGVTDTDGVRGRYNDSLAPVASWRSDIKHMQRPKKINKEDWKNVQEQLLLELEDVLIVNNLFDNLEALNTLLLGLVALELPAVASLVEVEEVQEVEDDPVTIFLKSLSEKIVETMVRYVTIEAGLQELRPVVELIYGALSKAFEEQPEAHPPDYRIEIKYAQLAREMERFFLGSLAAYGQQENLILTDWRRLDWVGRLVREGQWKWLPGTTQEIANTSLPAYTQYFLRALMPLKWKIVFACYVVPPLGDPFEQVPWHAKTVELGSHPVVEDTCWNWYMCNDQKAPSFAFKPKKDLSPYPSEELMKAIEDSGSSLEAFFRGEQNWTLPTDYDRSYSEQQYPCEQSEDWPKNDLNRR